MARDFASFWKDKSEQDTSLFKVRYKYAGNEKPKQELICDELERITELQNLAFTPLRQSMSDEAKSAQMQMKKDEHKHETDGIADALTELGEKIDSQDLEEVLIWIKNTSEQLISMESK